MIFIEKSSVFPSSALLNSIPNYNNFYHMSICTFANHYSNVARHNHLLLLKS